MKKIIAIFVGILLLGGIAILVINSNLIKTKGAGISLEDLDSFLADKELALMRAQERFGDLQIVWPQKHWLILAEAGFKKLKAPPAEMARLVRDDYSEDIGTGTLPKEYSIYSLVEGPFVRYFVRKQFEGSTGEYGIDVAEPTKMYDEWYGPF